MELSEPPRQEPDMRFAISIPQLQTLSYAAACTERIRLGCVVFVTPLHSPVHLAKNLSTLDQLSRGRIEIGVGTGGAIECFPRFRSIPPVWWPGSPKGCG